MDKGNRVSGNTPVMVWAWSLAPEEYRNLWNGQATYVVFMPLSCFGLIEYEVFETMVGEIFPYLGECVYAARVYDGMIRVYSNGESL